ncbi:LAFA_0B06612g1_1 [Lachancea sp. 'fantastica']|nr:LAFA_0B06612g1_1 [Lachancea sp. 'fantastica']
MNSSPFCGPVLVERAAFNRHDDQLSRKASEYLSALQDYTSTRLPSNPTLHSLRLKPGGSAPTAVEEMVVARLITHDYTEAVAILETDGQLGFLRKVELMVQVLILCQKWKHIDELCNRLNSFAESQSHQYTLLDEKSHITTRLLLCVAYYLQGRFLDCLKCFFVVIEEFPDVVQQLKNETPDSFCTHSELVTMISISLIVSIPLDNYEDVAQLEELEPFYKVAGSLTKWLKLLIETSYRKFLQEWSLLNPTCSSSIFLAQKWPAAQRVLRDKIYLFYLRISNAIEIPYLSETLCIEQDVVSDEIQMLIEELELNFAVEGLLVQSKERYNVQKLAEDLLDSGQLLQNKLDLLVTRNENLGSEVQGLMNENSAVGKRMCSPQAEMFEDDCDVDVSDCDNDRCS